MGEEEGDMMPERIFPYGDNHFTLNVLLEKPEVLSYLRRNGVEKSREALRKRLYKGLCNRSINEEVVMEYSRRTRPVPAPRKEKPRRGSRDFSDRCISLKSHTLRGGGGYPPPENLEI